MEGDFDSTEEEDEGLVRVAWVYKGGNDYWDWVDKNELVYHKKYPPEVEG